MTIISIVVIVFPDIVTNNICRSSFPVHKISGGLFTEEEKGGPEELAFKYAIYRINKDRSLVPNTTFVYDIQYVNKDDSFHAGKRGECDVFSFHFMLPLINHLFTPSSDPPQ